MSSSKQRTSVTLVEFTDIKSLDQHIDDLLAKATGNPRAHGHGLDMSSEVLEASRLDMTATATRSSIGDPLTKTPTPMQIVHKRWARDSRRIRRAQDLAHTRTGKTQAQKATLGPLWYNLPKTKLTPELKQDLQLLRMHEVLDPKRPFKRTHGRNARVPEFSQVGTVVEGPANYYSSRLPRKQRSRTLAEGLLADEAARSRFKSKYEDVQSLKTSGKKAHYRSKQSRRKRR